MELAVVPSGWSVEVLVIDNGSTDETYGVTQAAQKRNPCLRTVIEPTPGLGYARNRGLREACGEIILFTDDDLCVPPTWIRGMCEPILAGRGDAVAGGVIFPSIHASVLAKPPFSSRRGWFASTEDLDPLRPNRMVGANMALHRRIFAAGLKFDTDLGAGALGSGEETLLSAQIIESGYRLVGALDVAVEHRFDLKRANRKSLIDCARGAGRSHAYIFYHWEHQRSRLARLHLYLCRIRLWQLYCLRRIFGRELDRAYELRIQIEEELAFAHEYIQQSRRARKYARKVPASCCRQS